MLSDLRGIKSVISHGDVDGLACAAIALRRFPSAVVVFAEPYTVDRVLRGVARPVLILDIMAKGGNGVYVVDHHVNDEQSCTMLLSDWPEASDFLIKLGMAGDGGHVVEEDIVSKAAVLSDAISYDSDDNVFRAYAAKYMALNDDIPPESQSRAREFRKILSKKIAEAERRAKKIEDRLLIVYPDVGKGYVSRIAGMLSKKYATVAVVWINEGKTVVTLRGSGAKGVVEFFRNVDPRFCNGGGHAVAASFSTLTPVDAVVENVASILKNIR